MLTLFHYFVAQRRFVCVCLSFSRLVHLAHGVPACCLSSLNLHQLNLSIFLDWLKYLAFFQFLSGAGLPTCCLSSLNQHQLNLSIFLDWLNHLTFFQFLSGAGLPACCLSSLNLHQLNLSIFLDWLNHLTFFQFPCISNTIWRRSPDLLPIVT